MAFSFNGSNQYINGTLALDKPVTICIRANASSFPSYAIFMSFANSFIRELRFPSSKALQLVEYDGGETTVNAGTASTNTWYSCVGQWTNATSRAVFLDTTTTSNAATRNSTAATTSNLAIGARKWGSVDYPFPGSLAEAAVWSDTLNTDEIASLSKGFAPRRIRPQSLVFYAPLIRNLADTKGGLSLTNNNAAGAADHPRVY